MPSKVKLTLYLPGLNSMLIVASWFFQTGFCLEHWVQYTFDREDKFSPCSPWSHLPFPHLFLTLLYQLPDIIISAFSRGWNVSSLAWEQMSAITCSRWTLETTIWYWVATANTCSTDFSQVSNWASATSVSSCCKVRTQSLRPTASWTLWAMAASISWNRPWTCCLMDSPFSWISLFAWLRVTRAMSRASRLPSQDLEAFLYLLFTP